MTGIYFQAVNNIFIDGRTLKASLGTTKYCSHFMKNQTCPKHDCMYLHELGKTADKFISFAKSFSHLVLTRITFDFDVKPTKRLFRQFL
jgi:hypothetical protein